MSFGASRDGLLRLWDPGAAEVPVLLAMPLGLAHIITLPVTGTLMPHFVAGRMLAIGLSGQAHPKRRDALT